MKPRYSIEVSLKEMRLNENIVPLGVTSASKRREVDSEGPLHRRKGKRASEGKRGNEGKECERSEGNRETKMEH